MIVWIIVGILVLAILASILDQKKKASNQNKAFTQNGLAPTKKLGDFWIDETNKKWAVAKLGGMPKIHSFTDIIDFELVENGTNYKSKGGITRSLIGGLTFGVAGAVVGATTAKKQATINQLSINIFVSDISDPLVTINYINTEIKTDGIIYQNLIHLAKDTIAVLTAIKNQNDTIPS